MKICEDILVVYVNGKDVIWVVFVVFLLCIILFVSKCYYFFIFFLECGYGGFIWDFFIVCI